MFTFLIVDDDSDFHELHGMVISRCKQPVNMVEAKSGEEAYRILDSSDCQPDLVLLDINMPGMDGFEFLQQYPPRQIPIVMLSGSYESADRIKTLHTFDIVKNYYVKPLAVEDIKQLIDMLTQLKHEGT